MKTVNPRTRPVVYGVGGGPQTCPAGLCSPRAGSVIRMCELAAGHDESIKHRHRVNAVICFTWFGPSEVVPLKKAAPPWFP